MSTSAILPVQAAQIGSAGNTLADQLAQALLDLQNSLKTGDLTGASKALATFQKLEQTSVAQTGNTLQSVQLNSDAQTLGQALTAGNLTGANAALIALQKDFLNPVPPPAATRSGLSLADVTSLLSELPGGSNASTTTGGISDYFSSSTAATPDIGSAVLSALSAQSSATIEAAIAKATGTATAPAVTTAPAAVDASALVLATKAAASTAALSLVTPPPATNLFA